MKLKYPKNKDHFKKLIPFAKRIIKLCKAAGINPIIYGSFVHFYHTRDSGMKVNDLDLWIPEKKYPAIIKKLEKEKINFKYYTRWHTLIIEEGKLKVELDSLDYYYRDIKKKPYPKSFDKVDFYGEDMRIMKFPILEKFYEVALKESSETRKKVESRIKHLEKFLGRKLEWKRQFMLQIQPTNLKIKSNSPPLIIPRWSTNRSERPLFRRGVESCAIPNIFLINPR